MSAGFKESELDEFSAVACRLVRLRTRILGSVLDKSVNSIVELWIFNYMLLSEGCYDSKAGAAALLILFFRSQRLQE